MNRFAILALHCGLFSLLASCGGNGGDESPSKSTLAIGTGTPQMSVRTLQVSGKFLEAQPVAGATVVALDDSLSVPIATTTTAADGTFQFQVSSRSTSSIVIRATRPTPTLSYSYSIISSPTTGTSLIANVTPLTNAISALVSPSYSTDSLNTASGISPIVSTKVIASIKALITALQGDALIRENMKTAAGGNAQSYDPISTPFAAASLAIESQVGVVVSSSGIRLINQANPAAPSVNLTAAVLNDPEGVQRLAPSGPDVNTPSPATITSFTCNKPVIFVALDLLCVIEGTGLVSERTYVSPPLPNFFFEVADATQLNEIIIADCNGFPDPPYDDNATRLTRRCAVNHNGPLTARLKDRFRNGLITRGQSSTLVTVQRAAVRAVSQVSCRSLDITMKPLNLAKGECTVLGTNLDDLVTLTGCFAPNYPSQDASLLIASGRKFSGQFINMSGNCTNAANMELKGDVLVLDSLFDFVDQVPNPLVLFRYPL